MHKVKNVLTYTYTLCKYCIYRVSSSSASPGIPIKILTSQHVACGLYELISLFMAATNAWQFNCDYFYNSTTVFAVSE